MAPDLCERCVSIAAIHVFVAALRTVRSLLTPGVCADPGPGGPRRVGGPTSVRLHVPPRSPGKVGGRAARSGRRSRRLHPTRMSRGLDRRWRLGRTDARTPAVSTARTVCRSSLTGCGGGRHERLAGVGTHYCGRSSRRRGSGHPSARADRPALTDGVQRGPGRPTHAADWHKATILVRDFGRPVPPRAWRVRTSAGRRSPRSD